MNAMVCALRKMKNGGYLGGTACDFSIRIPKTQVDMEIFLAGGAHLLWNYIVSFFSSFRNPEYDLEYKLGARSDRRTMLNP